MKGLLLILLSFYFCNESFAQSLSDGFVAKSERQYYMKQSNKVDFVLEKTDEGKDDFYLKIEKHSSEIYLLTIYNKTNDAVVVNEQKLRLAFSDSKSLTWAYIDNSDSAVALQIAEKIVTLKKRVNPGNGQYAFMYVLYMTSVLSP